MLTLTPVGLYQILRPICCGELIALARNLRTKTIAKIANLERASGAPSPCLGQRPYNGDGAGSNHLDKLREHQLNAYNRRN
jgi:hypothetical protein